jgi:hypothetical protein
MEADAEVSSQIFVACGYDHVVANMFSVPLGILMGADLTVNEYIRKYVSFAHSNLHILCNNAYHRSLIAAWLGNLVGALLVALPATYFYLARHTPIPGTRGLFEDPAAAGRLRGAEEGEALPTTTGNTTGVALEHREGSETTSEGEKPWVRKMEDTS